MSDLRMEVQMNSQQHSDFIAKFTRAKGQKLYFRRSLRTTRHSKYVSSAITFTQYHQAIKIFKWDSNREKIDFLVNSRTFMNIQLFFLKV